MIMHKKFILLTFILSCAGLSTANAVVVDLKAVSMTADPTSLSFIADGVRVTAEGYHVEYDPADSSTTIYGPFSTTTAGSNANWTRPYFGRTLRTATGEVATGLGLVSTQNLGQTDDDRPAGGLRPGIDSMTVPGALPSFQFTLFRFDAPVDVSQVILDAVSNYKTSVWVAGGNTAPNLDLDFLSAFSAFSFANSPTLAGPIHSFTPFEGINYLAIGASPGQDIGNLGPIEALGRAQFYIDGINVSAVPVPAAVWLFGSGLLGLAGIARRNKTA